MGKKKFMPYSITPASPTYSPSQPLPQRLDHKPVYAMPYEHFDGVSPANTDVRYISIGMAQYDQDDVSIKTMRHTGTKWTRQAEELPVHRIIDMTVFLAKALFDCQNGNVTIPAGTFLNQTADLHISSEQRTYGERASYIAFLQQNSSVLKGRLRALAKILDDLRQTGKI
jgi:hypothetical protein